MKAPAVPAAAARPRNTRGWGTRGDSNGGPTVQSRRAANPPVVQSALYGRCRRRDKHDRCRQTDPHSHRKRGPNQPQKHFGNGEKVVCVCVCVLSQSVEKKEEHLDAKVFGIIGFNIAAASRVCLPKSCPWSSGFKRLFQSTMSQLQYISTFLPLN